MRRLAPIAACVALALSGSVQAHSFNLALTPDTGPQPRAALHVGAGSDAWG
jgi:hypothetical protein